MAIEFSHVRVISAGEGSVVGLSAYIGRSVARDEVSGETYRFTDKADLVAEGLLLPPGAEAYVGDVARLWNAALFAELTRDRRTGKDRFKVGAQVAISYVVALPKELTDAQRQEISEAYVNEKFAGKGVAVQWAVHDDSMSGAGNHHLHILHSTRSVGRGGFGKKVRELQPAFVRSKSKNVIVGARPGEEWREFQNRIFQERGWDLRVDPTRIVGALNEGDAHTIVDAEIKRINADRAARAQAAAYNPEAVLAHMTRRAPTFTARELAKFLEKSGVPFDERDALLARMLADKRVVKLRDEQGAVIRERFTTVGVLAQECAVLERIGPMVANAIPVSRRAAREAVKALPLEGEQLTAFKYATSENGLAVIKGRAGTGKSRVVTAIREAYEWDGHEVRGLAPTNTVARDMVEDGFSIGHTIDREMKLLEHERVIWSSRTVIIVDEAAMASARHLDALTAHAHRAGAKLILVGDERQLQSVERGGLFEPIADRASAVELTNVRRQRQAWQRATSEAMSRGDVAEALRSFANRGRLTWLESLDQARAALVQDYLAASRSEPRRSRFAFASTNDQAEKLNNEIRERRLVAGEITVGQSFATRKRYRTLKTDVSVGDRIQFHVTDRIAGFLNGEFATVRALPSQASGARRLLTVRKDDGSVLTFDASTHDQWGLGYAGTVYKGQGRTIDDVFALYDNPFAWNRNGSYVALTRQREDIRIYAAGEAAKRAADWTPSLIAEQAPRVGFEEARNRELAAQMRRTDDRRAAVSYQQFAQQNVNSHALTLASPGQSLTAAERQAMMGEARMRQRNSDGIEALTNPTDEERQLAMRRARERIAERKHRSKQTLKLS